MNKVIAIVVSAVVFSFIVYIIIGEIKFNSKCTEQGGITVNINNTSTCIEQPEILFVR